MKDLGASSGFIVTWWDTPRAIGNGITSVPWDSVVDRSATLWNV